MLLSKLANRNRALATRSPSIVAKGVPENLLVRTTQDQRGKVTLDATGRANHDRLPGRKQSTGGTAPKELQNLNGDVNKYIFKKLYLLW